jgi:DNA polymerase-3 subunit epsilon
VGAAVEFVAIDVETANANMASICQIGIAHFANGALTREWKTYVNPQEHFAGINISIHGIHEAQVVGAPTFATIANTVNSGLDGQIVVTHTAFDRLALGQAASLHRVAAPTCTWLDSASVVRRAWKQFSKSGYGLQNVCKSIGYHYQPHDALEDAKAAGNVLLAAMAQTGLDLNGWLARVGQPIEAGVEQRIARTGNPHGELCGEVMVFTGALSMPRREAADLAASVGCEVDEGVTKRTTILVVGDQDVLHLAGQEKSSKHRKAEELHRKGQPIRILRETDFRGLVKLSSGSHPLSRRTPFNVLQSG